MANSSAVETSQKQVHQIFINAPIQKVWDALTAEGEVLPFFFNSVLHTTTLAPGAPVRMRTKDEKYTGVVGEVLELNAPYLYSMTFKFTNFDDPTCKVTHNLEEKDGGTQYTLTSEKFTPGSKTQKQMKQGGDFIAKTLKGCVETGKPPFSSKLLLTMIGMFSIFTPKKCKTEYWPLDMRLPLED